jgi:hypothetical protein
MSDRSVPPGHLLFEAGALECFCGDIFASLDVPGADARPAAESPVESDLRGVESHGVIRLTVYADRLQAKATNPRPRIRAVARDLCNALKAPAERKRKLRSECHCHPLESLRRSGQRARIGCATGKGKGAKLIVRLAQGQTDLDVAKLCDDAVALIRNESGRGC